MESSLCIVIPFEGIVWGCIVLFVVALFFKVKKEYVKVIAIILMIGIFLFSFGTRGVKVIVFGRFGPALIEQNSKPPDFESKKQKNSV